MTEDDPDYVRNAAATKLSDDLKGIDRKIRDPYNVPNWEDESNYYMLIRTRSCHTEGYPTLEELESFDLASYDRIFRILSDYLYQCEHLTKDLMIKQQVRKTNHPSIRKLHSLIVAAGRALNESELVIKKDVAKGLYEW